MQVLSNKRSSLTMKVIAIILVIFIGGCASDENKQIGYLGFANNDKWEIQFNDCSVVTFEQAQPYIWFDRTLKSINCYTLKDSEVLVNRNKPIRAYSQPSKYSEYKEVVKFSELKVSESGWGTFPIVYEKVNSNWFRVADGWIYLNDSDNVIIDFYSGSQDLEEKRKHDAYFENH